MIEKTLLSGSISGESTQKDYGALARQYDSPEIPQIFHHIPHDRVVLYIRDPQAVHEWIVRAESQWSRWFGANSTDTVRSFLDRAFRLSSWRAVLASQYQEMAIILENTHLHYPELVYIVSGAQEDTVIQGWKENYR